MHHGIECKRLGAWLPPGQAFSTVRPDPGEKSASLERELAKSLDRPERDVLATSGGRMAVSH
jgi:hypothetical protein